MKQPLSPTLFDRQQQKVKVSELHPATPKAESVHSADIGVCFAEPGQEATNFLQRYCPLSSVFPIQQLLQSPNLSCKKYKTSAFYGELINGKKNGLGVMIYHSSRIFEGEWKNDSKNGKGTEKFPDGSIYQGNYEGGVFQGKGKYQWNNGQIYEGDWRKGERHGSGKWSSFDGDTYEGQWRLGKPDGLGLYVSASGVYQGEFKDSLKHGLGVEKFANGDMYRGKYTNGKPSGQGSYYWQNGSYFKGFFVNGLREGKGLWKRGVGNVDKYEGEYKNDKKWGYGEFTWSSGNKYKGHYQADLRHGYGQMFWSTGGWYKGQWLNGDQHGSGQLYIPGFGIKKGIFDQNQFLDDNQRKPRITSLVTPFNSNKVTARLTSKQATKDTPLIQKIADIDHEQKNERFYQCNRFQSIHSRDIGSKQIRKPSPQFKGNPIHRIRPYGQREKKIENQHHEERIHGGPIQQLSETRGCSSEGNKKPFKISQKRRLHSSYHFYQHGLYSYKKGSAELQQFKKLEERDGHGLDGASFEGVI